LVDRIPLHSTAASTGTAAEVYTQRRGIHTGFSLENRNEKEDWEGACKEEKIIYRKILHKQDRGMGWIRLARLVTDHLRPLANTVMNPQVQNNVGNIFRGQATGGI
jgi:hypothetical protein